ncbi:hypothetical protein [Rhodococcus aetherivorans]|uniref:hypothetical protein n=1 Tax=Rhodococcus aetherivorans TaxID=191292 RepID=UPI00241DDB9A|nr:hypothetical protein [Rhodococcus aetherivorans]WFS13561.1 hypothetical protein P9K37_00005 [Rhodococcus aetherivorans]
MLRGENGKGLPSRKYRSHSTQPVSGAHGSTRKVVGSGTMVRFGLPDSSGMSNPPPGLNGLKTMALAVSKKNGAMVISVPDSSAAR